MPFNRAYINEVCAQGVDLAGSEHQFEISLRSIQNNRLNQGLGNDDVELAALHLGLFLAHWGMFRGSSRLMGKNLSFFKSLIREYVFQQDIAALWATDFLDIGAGEAASIDAAINQLRKWIGDNGVTPTDTLVSKILLVTSGNVPAYDRYFRQGLKRINIQYVQDLPMTFSGNSLIALSNFMRRFTWPKIPSIIAPNGPSIPTGRLVDKAVNFFGRLPPE